MAHSEWAILLLYFEDFESKYDGAWKLTDKGENFDQYLADNGVNWFARMVASWMHPIFTFRHTSERLVSFNEENPLRSSSYEVYLKMAENCCDRDRVT